MFSQRKEWKDKKRKPLITAEAINDSILFKLLYFATVTFLVLYILKAESEELEIKWTPATQHRQGRGLHSEQEYAEHAYQHKDFGKFVHETVGEESHHEHLPGVFNIKKHDWYKILDDLEVPETEWEEFEYELTGDKEDFNEFEKDFEADVEEFDPEEGPRADMRVGGDYDADAEEEPQYYDDEEEFQEEDDSEDEGYDDDSDDDDDDSEYDDDDDDDADDDADDDDDDDTDDDEDYDESEDVLIFKSKKKSSDKKSSNKKSSANKKKSSSDKKDKSSSNKNTNDEEMTEKRKQFLANKEKRNQNKDDDEPEEMTEKRKQFLANKEKRNQNKDDDEPEEMTEKRKQFLENKAKRNQNKDDDEPEEMTEKRKQFLANKEKKNQNDKKKPSSNKKKPNSNKKKTSSKDKKQSNSAKDTNNNNRDKEEASKRDDMLAGYEETRFAQERDSFTTTTTTLAPTTADLLEEMLSGQRQIIGGGSNNKKNPDKNKKQNSNKNKKKKKKPSSNKQNNAAPTEAPKAEAGLKFQDLPRLHFKMLYEFNKRMDRLDDVLDGMPDKTKSAVSKPFELLERGDKKKYNLTDDDLGFKDFSENRNPIIDLIFTEIGYREKDLFSTGNTHILYMIPLTIALNTGKEDHVSFYTHYINFLKQFQGYFDRKEPTNKLTLAIGNYHSEVKIQPENADYQPKRFPWPRIAQTYKTPKAVVQQPKIKVLFEGIAAHLDKENKFSEATEGQDCFVIVMHHDTFSDLWQAMHSETFINARNAVHAACTMINIFIGFQKYEADIKRYMNFINPHLMEFTVLDPNYYGYFIVKKHNDLNEDLVDKVVAYMGLIKKRQGCRITMKNYVPKVEEEEPVKQESRFNSYGYGDYNDDEAENDWNDSQTDENGFFTTAAPLQAAEVAKDRVNMATNVCCGSSMWTGRGYNDVIKVCCRGMVKWWGEDDENPCH